MKPTARKHVPTLVPTIAEPDVKWLASQQTCRVKYYNHEKGCWATKTKRVPAMGSPTKFQDSIDKAAAALQEYRNLYHSEPPED
eukprot:8249297-Pyramimonas_sp.AAC.1